jgi:NADPH-dependent 2,4-dienoyl-CoA reductase/sulfur reductase-like enzyme
MAESLHRLARVTLVYDRARPGGIMLDLDIGEPVDGLTGEDLALAVLAAARLIAQAVDTSWAHQLAERN